MRMIHLVCAAAIALLLAGCSSKVLVTRVVDGDTVVLQGGERVRYIGIDTPETVHPQEPVEYMGPEASAFNRKLVEGRRVRLEFDAQERDRYGRLLAYVYVGEVFVNAELLRAGYARVMTVPPNVKHSEEFLRLEREARAAEIGLWRIPDRDEPAGEKN